MVDMADDKGEVSDGFHTFNELYDHRLALTAALVKKAGFLPAWRSKAHHPDQGPIYPGYFIVGLDLPTGTVSYHYKLEHWDKFPLATELDHAPLWDGSTPADTVDRLVRYAIGDY